MAAFDGVSRLHLTTREILEEGGFDFIEEYSFPDLVASSGHPLRFDFAVLTDDGEIDFLVEVQGEQHYIPVKGFGGNKKLQRQKHNDAQKRRYCITHDIRLLEIPFYDFEKGEVSLDYIFQKLDL